MGWVVHNLFKGKTSTVTKLNSIKDFFQSRIFPSTFLQPVNGKKNSILNWVMKLNLFMCLQLNPFFFVFETSLKDFPFCSPILLTLWFRYLQTRIKKTCMYAQTQKFPEKSKKNPFSSNLPTWISNISSDVYHRAAPSSHWAKQTLKKLILWGKTAVDRSSWIKAWLYKY